MSASKRTATGRRKAVAGRSSDAFDHSIFVNKAAYDKYKEIKHKKFATERAWNIDDFTEATEIQGVTKKILWRQQLEGLGLARLVEFRGEYVPSLVLEFYANAGEWSPKPYAEYIISRVRGVDLRVTPEAIADIFGLPLVDDFTNMKVVPITIDRKLLRQDTPEGRAKVGAGWLKGEYIALFKSLCANIMPTTHDKEYDRERLGVGYAIASGISYRTPAIMIKKMIEGIKGIKRAALPFPGVITEILKRAGVGMDGYVRGIARITTKIDATTVRKALRATEAHAREEEEVEEIGGDTEAEDMATPGLRRMVQELSVRVTRIEEKQDRSLRLEEDAYRIRRLQHPEWYEDQPYYAPYEQPGSSSGQF